MFFRHLSTARQSVFPPHLFTGGMYCTCFGSCFGLADSPPPPPLMGCLLLFWHSPAPMKRTQVNANSRDGAISLRCRKLLFEICDACEKQCCPGQVFSQAKVSRHHYSSSFCLPSCAEAKTPDTARGKKEKDCAAMLTMKSEMEIPRKLATRSNWRRWRTIG